MKPHKSTKEGSSTWHWVRIFALSVLLVYFGTGFSCSQTSISDPSDYDTGANNGESYIPVDIRVALQDDLRRRVFVGGRFSSLSNTRSINIAYWDIEQEQWHALSGGGLTYTEYTDGSSVNALSILGDYLYVGGTFDSTADLGTSGLNGIARYNLNSNQWEPLAGNGLNGTVNAISVEGTTVFVGGSFSRTFNNTVFSLNNIAVYADSSGNGYWLPAAEAGLNNTVNTFTHCNGALIAGGVFTGGFNGGGSPLNRIARYENSSWSPLTSNGLNGEVLALECAGPGEMYVGGSFTSAFAGGTALNRIARYEFINSGTWIQMTNTGLNGDVQALKYKVSVPGHGDLYVGGDFTATADGSVLDLNRLAHFDDRPGNYDWNRFPGDGLNGPVHTIEKYNIPNINQNYRLIVGGQFSQSGDASSSPSLNGAITYHVTPNPLLQNGSGSTTISGLSEMGFFTGIALNGPVNSVASNTSGNIYVGGTFTGANNTASALNRIARFDPITRTWTPLANNGLNGSVEALWTVGSDLYVGGSFTATADGAVTNLNRMARYNLTTNTWHSVGNNGLNGNVLSFAQKGNELWVGGSFTRTFDSAVLSLNNLARYNLMTGTWSAVPNGGMNGPVNALAFKGDDLYLGGGFTRTFDNNYFLFYFTKVDTATGIYYELANSGTNFAVERLRLDGNDLYVSGQFTRTHDNTIILDQLGRYDTVLNGWNAVYGYSDELALGRLLNASVDLNNDRYIGGDFHRVGNTVAHYFTRLYGQVWNVPSSNSDWHDGANWTTNAVPATNTSAVIPAYSGAVNITASDVTLADLIINGGTLTVAAGRTLTINGILKLGGGVIQGDGTVVVTNCKRDRVMGGSTASHVRTKLVRCVDNAGTYVFPVGTAQGYAPIFVGEISGTGNVSVQPFEGEYALSAAGLPTNRLRRWWTIENPGGGVTNSQLIFNYSYPDIISNEPTYKAYRISGGTATVASAVANTFTHRVTAPNVTAFSDWTIAGDPGGPTPTPTPIPPTPTPTPTPLPSPTPTPTPTPTPDPTPTPTPEPTPTPTPTPTPPPVPTLGTYSNANLALSGNTVVIPSGAPNGALTLNASTDSRFRGTLVADPATGNVIVSNAHPAGVYTIKVTAFGSGGSTTATLILTVTDGAECTQTVAFTDGNDIFAAYFPTSLAIGDINNDGDQDIAIMSEAFDAVSIMLGDGTGAFTNAGDVGITFGAVAIDLADINNDGKLDLIAATSGRLANRLGNGDGTFTNLPIINFTDSPDGLAVGDMNNDGKRDIVLTFAAPAKVIVLTGDGAGAFTVGPDVPVGSGPHDVVLADVNSDGNTDVLSANGGSNNVSVRLGDGLGGLSGTTEITVGMTPISLTTGLFDADGNLDLATANSGDGTVSIRNGDGLGGFAGATNLSSATTPTVVTSGDIDNDGVHDIVIGDSTTPADIINFGDGSGGFATTLSLPAGGWPYVIRIGDLNTDGRQDLVTGNWFSYQTTIRLGSCYTPTPTPTPTPEPTPTPQTNNITVSDNNFTVGSYNTLKEAFDAVNAGTHTGTINMTVNADTVETAMTNITYSGDGFANYASITISPAPGGPRLISGAMPDGDALIDLNGADNVVIDGINSGGTTLTLANTSTTSFGISSTIRFENGATSNILRNTNVFGSVNGGNTSVILFYDDAVTPNGNDNNTIENCNIGPFGMNAPSRGIYGLGQSFDTNIGNSGNIINDNNIYDFFNPTGESNGIYLLAGSKFWSITNNRFYQTAPRVAQFGHVHNVIRLDNPNPPNGVEGMTITGNVIGYSAADGSGTYTIAGTSSFSAIRARIFVGGAPTTISNNTISGISLANSSAGLTFYGIHLEQGPFITNNNLIGSMSATDAITVDFNTTVDVINAGIINFATSSDWTANNNQIGGIRVSNANIGGPQVYGIWGFRTSPNLAGLTGNTVGGTVPDSMNVTGFGTNQQVIGIATNFSSTVTGNTVQNLTTNSGSGTAANASAIGILTNNAAVDQTVSNNVIRNIRNSRTVGTNVVTGIQFTGSTSNTVERNHISKLLNDSNGTSAEVNGIRVGGGTTAYRNNMIAVGDGVPSAIGTGASTGGISGINETAGTNTLFHNSAYIGGTPTAGNGASYAFKSTQVTVGRSVRNNIFVNARSNSGASGTNYAVRVGGTTPNPAGLTINNNVYASVGTGAVFGYFNNANVANIAAWQSAVGQDAASIEGDPGFVAPTAATPDLHLSTSLVSIAQDVGADVGVAIDFDNQLRPSGGGFDIGADEALAPSAATVSVGGRLTTSMGNGIRNAIVTLTDSNGNIRTMQTGSFGYYRFDGVNVGQAYVLSVTSKRHQFIDPSRLILLGEDALEIDFVAIP